MAIHVALHRYRQSITLPVNDAAGEFFERHQPSDEAIRRPNAMTHQNDRRSPRRQTSRLLRSIRCVACKRSIHESI